MAEYIRLNEACEINMGQSPDSNSYNENGEGLPFFQGNADFGDVYPKTRVWCSIPTKIVEPETLLISVRAPIGALNFAKERSCIGRGLAGISAKDNFKNRYIYFCLKKKKNELNDKGTGSTFKAIAKNALGETLVRKVSLSEQNHIIEVLNNVQGVIDNRKRVIAEFDALIKARFVEMFGDIEINSKGWKKEPLQNHIDMITGYPLDSSKYADKGIKICGGLIIMPDVIKWAECKYWESIGGYEQFLLAENDIVVALDRPWISEGFKIGTIAEEDLPALLIQRTARIRGKDMNQKFILYLLKDKSFEQHCTVTGSLVPHISNKDINSYEIIVPPIGLQNEFADYVAQVDKSKVVVQKSLDETQLLFNSLMQKYFG